MTHVYIGTITTPKGLDFPVGNSNAIFEMPRSLQSRSKNIHEATGRTINSPALFKILSAEIRDDLLKTAVQRDFADGQIIHQRGDLANGFWVIESGQVKMGRFNIDGDMQVVVIMGVGDSFGELACLGGLARVVDAVAVGKTQMLWISEAEFFRVLERSPTAMREVLKLFARQLQETLDILVAVRKWPAKKQLARILIALCGERVAPVKLTIRHNELAELVGVSRMTVGTALCELELSGLLVRGYRSIIVSDPKLLTGWMRSI